MRVTLSTRELHHAVSYDNLDLKDAQGVCRKLTFPLLADARPLATGFPATSVVTTRWNVVINVSQHTMMLKPRSAQTDRYQVPQFVVKPVQTASSAKCALVKTSRIQ